MWQILHDRGEQIWFGDSCNKDGVSSTVTELKRLFSRSLVEYLHYFFSLTVQTFVGFLMVLCPML